MREKENQRREQEYDANDKYSWTKDSDSTTKKRPRQRFTEYAWLNAPISQIVMEIEKDRDVKWPKPLKPDPEKRNKNQYCIFHKDTGHDTDNCHQLKDEIEF